VWAEHVDREDALVVEDGAGDEEPATVLPTLAITLRHE
jgi:hypothetical protein